MLIDCAWCKRIIGEKSDEGYTGDLTTPTSGICPECFALHCPEEYAIYKQKKGEGKP